MVIANEELLQVITYKTVFQKSLGRFPPERIHVVVIGDRFELEVDRKALATQGFELLSYIELC